MKDNGKIVFLFSGQGGQYRGMGQKLYRQNPVFRDTLQTGDAIVRKLLNRSLLGELYAAETNDLFDDLLITHPAIVTVEIAMYRVLQAMGIKPDYILGSSLGEYAAGVASGIWSVEIAIEAAIEQAKSVVRNDLKGGMLAVISPHQKNVQQLYSKHNLYLASINFDQHFTVSGLTEDLDAFQLELEGLDIHYFRLPVSYPFHSPLIEGGGHGFVYYLNSLRYLSPPKPGFISGLKGEEMQAVPLSYFWEVASKPFDFPATVNYLERAGAGLYIDLGPSGTSATFVKYNLCRPSGSQTFQIMTPFKKEDEQLEKLRALLRP